MHDGDAPLASVVVAEKGARRLDRPILAAQPVCFPIPTTAGQRSGEMRSTIPSSCRTKIYDPWSQESPTPLLFESFWSEFEMLGQLSQTSPMPSPSASA